MSTLTEDVLSEIAAERRRQVTSEGWTIEHDDEHTDGSMAMAAAVYAHPNMPATEKRTDLVERGRSAGESIMYPLVSAVPSLWPRAWTAYWYKPKNRRRDLVRAAALIVAEIERLDRATGKIAGPGPMQVQHPSPCWCPYCGEPHSPAVREQK